MKYFQGIRKLGKIIENSKTIGEIKTNIDKSRENKQGITLIALVVTIVVLLILAGITINLLFSNGGIFDIANQAKIEHEIGALKDRINNVIADWSIERAIDSSITVDVLWEKMVDADIIDNPKEDVSGPKKEGENDRYELTTNEGYIVEIIISPDGNVSIGDVEKGDKLPPKIGEITSTSESNSIHIEVEITRSEGEVSLNYYYKKEGEADSSYTALKEGTKELTADFTGLEQGVVYNIKVVIEDRNGTAEKTINVTTGKLTGSVTQKGETIWKNGTASIHLETEAQNLSILYQINSIEGTYQTYDDAKGITGLEHGDTVFAVLSDGTNITDYTSIDVLDKLGPTVTVKQGSKSTNNIQVSVSSSDAEWGMPDSITYNYYIKKTADGNYPQNPTHTGTETSYTFTGLIQNTSYDVKVTTSDKAGNLGSGQVTNITTDTVGGAGDDLKEGNIIASDPTWSNGSASITLSKGTEVASSLIIQYQVGDIAEGNWTTAQEGAASVTVTGLKHNDIVYARLTDGTNYGSYASVTILDKLPPQNAKIELSGQSTTTTGNITATVTHIDNESGVEATNCRWGYNTNSNLIGTEISSYSNTFSNNGQIITLNVNNPGTYYLHVLTIDMAGNATETISNPITINQLITQLTLDHTELTLEEGQSSTLIAQILPENATNKTLSWESNNTAVATVENGIISAVQAGNAVITVKTTDGSNLTATCNVTVNKPLPTVKDTLKEGEYVQYIDKSGITRRCIVIYDSTSGYGTQVVTERGVDSVTIGVEGDLETSIEEYNNIINTLNTKAKEYLNTDYASSARCLGSNPINPAAQSGYYRDKGFNFSEYNGKLRDGDENYVSDLEKIKSYNRSCRNVWLASRYVVQSEDTGRVTFYVASVGTSSSKYTVNEICIFGSSISDYSKSETMEICPVFTLKDNVKINGGSGTSSDPYTLTI